MGHRLLRQPSPQKDIRKIILVKVPHSFVDGPIREILLVDRLEWGGKTTVSFLPSHLDM